MKKPTIIDALHASKYNEIVEALKALPLTLWQVSQLRLIIEQKRWDIIRKDRP